MSDEKWIMKDMTMAQFGVLSWHLPEWMEENHKKPHTALPESGFKFEP
jgi:hypothetical protein